MDDIGLPSTEEKNAGAPSLPRFIHLRVHTAYSLSESTLRIDKLALLASEYKMPALAITDSFNLFGA